MPLLVFKSTLSSKILMVHVVCCKYLGYSWQENKKLLSLYFSNLLSKILCFLIFAVDRTIFISKIWVIGVSTNILIIFQLSFSISREGIRILIQLWQVIWMSKRMRFRNQVCWYSSNWVIKIIMRRVLSILSFWILLKLFIWKI